MLDMTQDRERVKSILQDLSIRFPVNAPVKKPGYLDDDEEEEE